LRHALSRATETVRERLLAQSSPEHRNMVRKALKEVSGRVSGSISTRQYLEAEKRLASVTQDTALTKVKLREFAGARQLPETVVALSALCGVPIDLVDHLVNNSSPFGLMVLGRAIDLNWSVVSMIMRSRPSAEGATLDPTEMGNQFHQLSVSSAQRILRFWQSRQEQDVTAGNSLVA
jgi:hypothetical protein